MYTVRNCKGGGICRWPNHNSGCNVKGISCKRVHWTQIVKNMVCCWLTVKKKGVNKIPFPENWLKVLTI